MIPNFRGIAVLVVIALISTVGVSAKKKVSTPEATPQDSLNRALAVVMAANIDEVMNDLARAHVEVDRAEVGRYISEIMSGRDIGVSRLMANAYVEDAIRSHRPERPDSVTAASQQEFLAAAASQPGAVVLPSGVVFIVITEGEGVMPTEADKVKVKYVARLSDGTPFDDTEGEAIEFDVAKVIPGFGLGVQQMKPGGTYRIVIPSSLGYGAPGIPGIIPGGAALDFTITLDEVIPGK